MTTQDFAQLIDARLAVLVQLLALSRRQATVINDSELSTLLTLLAGKQQLVNQLQVLDRQLAPYQQQSPESRHWASQSERTRCQQQAARCEAVLREILVTEKQAEDHLVQQRDAVSQRLAAVNQSDHAARSYIPAPSTLASGLLDLTSEG